MLIWNSTRWIFFCGVATGKSQCTILPLWHAVLIIRPCLQLCLRFFRRCWVTFDRSVNIKETCWNLQNIRVTGSHTRKLYVHVESHLKGRVSCVASFSSETVNWPRWWTEISADACAMSTVWRTTNQWWGTTSGSRHDSSTAWTREGNCGPERWAASLFRTRVTNLFSPTNQELRHVYWVVQGQPVCNTLRK